MKEIEKAPNSLIRTDREKEFLRQEKIHLQKGKPKKEKKNKDSQSSVGIAKKKKMKKK